MSSLEHPSERGGAERAGGVFERFSEAASNLTSSPLFYGFCVALVGAFIAAHVARLGVEWELALGGGLSAVTLLLLALLTNSEGIELPGLRPLGVVSWRVARRRRSGGRVVVGA